jgi:hypothetical protein
MSAPTEKRDPTFGERFVVPLVVIFVTAPLLGFPAAMYWHAEPKNYWRAIPILIVLAGMILGLGLLHHRVLRRYRCPQCGSRLPQYAGERDPEKAREYRFFCEACNVLWTTGLKSGED